MEEVKFIIETNNKLFSPTLPTHLLHNIFYAGYGEAISREFCQVLNNNDFEHSYLMNLHDE